VAEKLTDEERALIRKHREKTAGSRPAISARATFDLGDDKAVARAQKLGLLPSDDDEDDDEDDEDREDEDTPKRRGFFGAE
jgi:hypothetical protein